METTYDFQFDTIPVAKERPRLRVVGQGKRAFATAYTPEKTKTYEREIRASAAAQMVALGITTLSSEQPVHIDCVFCMPRPESRKSDQYHLTVPDIDNLLKAILDGIQGPLLTDDKSVVSLSVSKRYSGLDGFVGTLLRVTLLPVTALEKKCGTRKKTTPKTINAELKHQVTGLPAGEAVQSAGRRAPTANRRKKQTGKADG